MGPASGLCPRGGSAQDHEYLLKLAVTSLSKAFIWKTAESLLPYFSLQELKVKALEKAEDLEKSHHQYRILLKWQEHRFSNDR